MQPQEQGLDDQDNSHHMVVMVSSCYYHQSLAVYDTDLCICVGGTGTYRYNRPYGMSGMAPYGRPMSVPMRPGLYDSMPGARPYGGYPQPEMAASVYPANYGAMSAYPG